MNKFAGSKCIVCEKEFKEDDDIVICPDCGTPYHRECYAKNGKCINDELHQNGGEWQPEKAEQNPNIIVCPKCGKENPKGSKFCNDCGSLLEESLVSGQPFQNPVELFPGEKPQNPQDIQARTTIVKLTGMDDLDGNTINDYVNYVGERKKHYFIPKFITFAKTPLKSSINFWALIIPEYYFFYRKMFGVGTVVMLLLTALSIPSCMTVFNEFFNIGSGFNFKGSTFNAIYNICYFVSIAIRIFCTLKADKIYYDKAKEDITRIKKNNQDEPELSQNIKKKGGTSILAVILSFFANGFIITAFCSLIFNTNLLG